MAVTNRSSVVFAGAYVLRVSPLVKDGELCSNRIIVGIGMDNLLRVAWSALDLMYMGEMMIIDGRSCRYRAAIVMTLVTVLRVFILRKRTLLTGMLRIRVLVVVSELNIALVRLKFVRVGVTLC